MSLLEDQKKYGFMGYDQTLQKNIHNLPLFFVTEQDGVKFLNDNDLFVNNQKIYISDNDDSYHMIRNLNNGKFEYMFDDCSEPEDNNLVRDWIFLCKLFEDLLRENFEEKK